MKKIGRLGPHRIAAQNDPLNHQVGVDVHQHPVLEGAGLHFVGVGHHIARKARIGGDERPFAAGGKAGAAPAPEAGVQHQLPDLLRRPLFHGLDQRLIAAALPVLLNSGRAVGPAIFEQDFFSHRVHYELAAQP